MRTPFLLGLLLAASLAGCVGCHSATLTATLLDPNDIRLDWPGAPAGALGQVVEYANQPSSRFVTLARLGPDATTYTHPRLLPKTPFYYRVRAYFGQRTRPVSASVNTGAAPPADPQWATPRTEPGSAGDDHSMRDSGAGGPTDLRADPVGPEGVRLMWTDHALDEDGYLVEVTAANTGTSRVAAVLAPKTDEVGVFPLPAEHSATYRIVAFYYGPPSPVVHQTTD